MGFKKYKKAARILDIYSKFGQIGIWYYDKIESEEEVSAEWCAMLGYTYDELNPASEAQFERLLHPDDRKRVIKSYKAFVKGLVHEYNNEFRLQHKKGHYIWVLSKAQVYSWDGSNPRLIIGTHINIDKQKRALENVMRQNQAIIEVLTKTVEFKDSYTRSHMENVAKLSVRVGYRLGLEEVELQRLWISSKLHDLGKLSIPTHILNKPGKLTDDEFKEVKNHSTVGYELLKDFDFGFPLAEIVNQHHERLDGSGYPNGLKGEDIHYLAQVIAVCDIADAMLSDRPYRKGMPQEEVFSIMASYTDHWYYAEIINACIQEIKEMQTLMT